MRSSAAVRLTMEQGREITEVPLVYPCHKGCRRRFLLNDVEGTIGEHPENDGHSPGDGSEEPFYTDAVELDGLRGSASVSALRWGTEKEAVVTTFSLPDEPEVLVISISRSCMTSTSVELDLGEKMTNFSRPVKVQCFALEEGSDATISMTMIDSKGNILSLLMDAETLAPLASSLRICSVQELVMNSMGDGDAIDTDSQIHSAQVAFISSTVVLVAISSLLLSVDVHAGSIDVWSEIDCLEKMNKAALYDRLLSVAGMVLGGGGGSMVDMPPTAALCAASGDSSMVEVFTLHSDSSLRKWRLDPSSSLLPYWVDNIQVSQQIPVGDKTPIPPPSVWSHSSNAVSICARLYDEVFALAVSVRTNYSSTSDKEGCSLSVFHGPQEATEPLDSNLVLSVPDNASLLEGMDFVHNMNRCSLRAVFRMEPQSRGDFGGTVVATYPPNIMSIVTAQPLLTPVENTLEGVAMSERDRISSLSFDLENPTATIDEDLHELDSKYMKYLFCPLYPRGSGTVVAPNVSSIRKAIAKLVPGFRMMEDPTMNIQLETLQAMHTWRKIDSSNSLLATPSNPFKTSKSKSTSISESNALTVYPQTKAPSVYYSFVGGDMTEAERTTPDNTRPDDEMDVDQEDYARNVQATAHQKRWKSLLLAVWEEERVLRSPLCLANTPYTNGPEIFLVRAGVVSVLSEKSSPGIANRQETRWDTLDKAAAALVSRIQGKKDKCDRLSAVEAGVVGIIAKAQLVLPSAEGEENMENVTRELRSLGAWSLDDEIQASEGVLPDVSRNVVEEIVGSVDSDALMTWLLQLPTTGSETSRSFPGLCFLSEEIAKADAGQSAVRTNRVSPTNTRHAASHLAIRCIDSVRRLHLGRCLLLFGMRHHGGSSGWPLANPAQQCVLMSYLHTVSVMWTCAQLVPTPSAVIQPSAGSKQGLEEILLMPADDKAARARPLPPSDTKNASSGLVPSQSRPGAANMTTALDAHMIHLSQSLDLEACSLDVAVRLACSFFVSSSGLNTLGHIHGKAVLKLPELGALPTPANESVVSDYPRLALRLLAPFIAFAPARDSSQVLCARREAAAECLLIESNMLSRTGAIDESRKREVIQTACELLVPSVGLASQSSSDDMKLIESAFDSLVSAARESSWMDSGAMEDSLEGRLLELLSNNGELPGAVTSMDVRRLCQNAATRELLSPLFSSNLLVEMNQVKLLGMRRLVFSFLRVSNLTYRLSVLERHLSRVGRTHGSSSSGSVILIEYIESAIAEVSELLPAKVYGSMQEYATLWSMLFRHSVTGHRWRKAYDACVKNPVLNRKVNNYRKLVAAMIDCGELGELLELCSVVTGGASSTEMMVEDGSECVVLYELAAETLVDNIKRAVEFKSSGPRDYGGCLYALHAHVGHWREATHAMSLTYQCTSTFLAKVEQACVESVIKHLSLSSVAALNALLAIKDPTQRFLVADGSSHKIMNFGETKDPYDGSMDIEQVEDSRARSSLSEPLSTTSLSWQCARAIALRTLLLDGPESYGKLFDSLPVNGCVEEKVAEFLQLFFLDKSNSEATDHQLIDVLSSSGYYQHALLVAVTMRNSYQELRGGQPNGRDQFDDAICYMVNSYLLPKAVSTAGMAPNGDFCSRPTYSQLRRSLRSIDGDDSSILPSHDIRERWGKASCAADVTKSAAAMALIRALVSTHATRFSPITLEVAEGFLDHGACGAQLPNWLYRFLVGGATSQNGPNDGLFARKSSGSVYSGDPAGLLRLYLKKGRHVEACNLVCEVLASSTRDGGIDVTRQSQASSRLPEKGDIDFIPLGIIDVLWNELVVSISLSSTRAATKQRMRVAQVNLEQALEKHFDLASVSEMGMQSVRVLNR